MSRREFSSMVPVRSESIDAVMEHYGGLGGLQGEVTQRLGYQGSDRVAAIGFEVRSEEGVDRYILEIPYNLESQDGESQPLRNMRKGTEWALVIQADDQCDLAGYHGSVQAAIPLPSDESAKGYSIDPNAPRFLRHMDRPEVLVNLDS